MAYRTSPYLSIIAIFKYYNFWIRVSWGGIPIFFEYLLIRNGSSGILKIWCSSDARRQWCVICFHNSFESAHHVVQLLLSQESGVSFCTWCNTLQSEFPPMCIACVKLDGNCVLRMAHVAGRDILLSLGCTEYIYCVLVCLGRRSLRMFLCGSFVYNHLLVIFVSFPSGDFPNFPVYCRMI